MIRGTMLKGLTGIEVQTYSTCMENNDSERKSLQTVVKTNSQRGCYTNSICICNYKHAQVHTFNYVYAIRIMEIFVCADLTLNK